MAFDGLSIGVAHVSTLDDADSAALSASRAWAQNHDAHAALDAAEQSASQHGESVLPDTLRIAADGTVTVAITRTATTLLLAHVHQLHSWTVVKETGSGRYTG